MNIDRYWLAVLVFFSVLLSISFVSANDTSDSLQNQAHLSYRLPFITGVSPASVTTGSTELNITLRGWNFQPDSVVLWNGEETTTTYLSQGTLVALIPESDITATCVARITVLNPGSKGGMSNPRIIRVRNQTPDQPPNSIWVESNPQGAAIAIDGNETGIYTPSLLTNVSAGFHTVTVSVQGYAPAFGSVGFADGGHASFRFALMPL
jgi:hypothetical protein